MKRPVLAALVPLYAAGAAAQRLAYDKGVLRARMLQHPVVSVGNLSTGGAGKTPFVMYLAGRLEARGWTVDVLSRGYRGSAGGEAERVDAEGAAAKYGDEPLMMARTGMRVYVGHDRFAAGALAEAQAGSGAGGDERQVHILDDGFQHRRLARDADILLLHADDFSDGLLPAGNLREPLSAMGRADFLVLREGHRALEHEVVRRTGRAPWIMRRWVEVPMAGVRPLAFCALARPMEFYRDLRYAGVALVGEASFPDHHRYTAADLKRILELAKQHGADALITTEKDAVKLPPSMLETLKQAGAFSVARLSVTLEREDEFLAAVAERIA